jgi:hypothetical protein
MPAPTTIRIDEIEYVRKDSIPAIPKPAGTYAIVRCRNAGVHAGYVKSRENGVLTLTSSRRLWRWWSKATLSELALEGPRKDKINEQRYGAVLPVLKLTESDVCEVIPTTEEACQAIQRVSVWTA